MMKRTARILSVVFTAAGLLVGAWAVTVWLWQDPFTAIYTHYEQAKLARSLDHQIASFPVRHQTKLSVAREQRLVAADAARARRNAHVGQAVGRLIVPRMGLNIVVVNGTDHSTLEKGPGRYLGAAMPGEGKLVYIAGHRTTYLAPFSKIDQMRKGDLVTLEMPYATFVYRVSGHRIVPANDLAVLRSHGHEVLELQACHPRFFATHRYIVYALPVKTIPRIGRAYGAGATATPVARRCAPRPATPLAAVVQSSAVVYRRPDGPALRRYGRKDVNGARTVFGVLDARGCAHSWYRVQLPVRPNGTSGWVRAKDVQVLPVDTKIVIHVKAMRLELWSAGRVVLRTPIAPGAPATPTPTGRFYVTERQVPADPSGPWGPAALGTSAFSPVLKHWAQGGPIGIHGTNEPSAIGHAVSHGCIRLPNSTMSRLFRLTPAGTPILIRA
jgi:sortase A